MTDDHVRTTLYLTLSLRRKLRQRAHEAGTSMSQLVELYCWYGLQDDKLADELTARNREGPDTTSPAAGPSEPTN